MKTSGKSVLELEIEELENACKHLRRSNQEIEQFLSEGGGAEDEDGTFKNAIEENIRVIAQKEAKIESLKDQLRRAVSGTGSLCNQQHLDLESSATSTSTSVSQKQESKAVETKEQEEAPVEGVYV